MTDKGATNAVTHTNQSRKPGQRLSAATPRKPEVPHSPFSGGGFWKWKKKTEEGKKLKLLEGREKIGSMTREKAQIALPRDVFDRPAKKKRKKES